MNIDPLSFLDEILLNISAGNPLFIYIYFFFMVLELVISFIHHKHETAYLPPWIFPTVNVFQRREVTEMGMNPSLGKDSLNLLYWEACRRNIAWISVCLIARIYSYIPLVVGLNSFRIDSSAYWLDGMKSASYHLVLLCFPVLVWMNMIHIGHPATFGD